MKKHNRCLLYSTIILVASLYVLFSVAFCQAATQGYTLTWDANTEPDLAGYRVYVSTESGVYGEHLPELGLVTVYEGEIDVPDDALTTYYWALTAFDDTNLESDFSNEVSHTFDTRVPPAPPTGLSWFERLIAWIKSWFIWG